MPTGKGRPCQLYVYGKLQQGKRDEHHREANLDKIKADFEFDRLIEVNQKKAWK